MGASDNIKEFVALLQQSRKEGEKVQTVWATVKEVDWNAKTMTATGETDGLDFNEVLLGLGIVYLKPKQGSKCLLGLIENKDAAAFLIDAEEVEEAALKFSKITVDCTDIVFNGGDNKGLAVVQKIADRFNEIETALSQIKTQYVTHTHTIPGVGTTGTPSSGLTYTVPNSQAAHFENTEIKH